MSNESHYQQIADIHSIMERNTRFISLSGLSGISAGVIAIIGSIVANLRIDSFFKEQDFSQDAFFKLELQLIGLAACILIAAIAFSWLFTSRKAKADGQKVWNRTTRKILMNLAIPLVTGGVFALILLYYNLFVLIAPVTLIFYGLACVNASHNTVTQIKFLGLSVIVLGLINLFFLGHGLIFWTLGFGFMHILYGMIMYLKYERG